MKRLWLWILAGLLLLDGIGGYWWWYERRDHRHDRIILTAARRYGVDPALVKAVVWRESRFNTEAHGQANEIGLMQIREAAALEWAATERLRDFRHEFLYHPQLNVLAGSWYLKKLLHRYRYTDNPLPYALADYNAGRGHLLRWIQGPALTNSQLFLAQMTFPGTRKYVLSVSDRYAYYRQVFADPAQQP